MHTVIYIRYIHAHIYVYICIWVFFKYIAFLVSSDIEYFRSSYCQVTLRWDCIKKKNSWSEVELSGRALACLDLFLALREPEEGREKRRKRGREGRMGENINSFSSSCCYFKCREGLGRAQSLTITECPWWWLSASENHCLVMAVPIPLLPSTCSNRSTSFQVWSLNTNKTVCAGLQRGSI